MTDLLASTQDICRLFILGNWSASAGDAIDSDGSPLPIVLPRQGSTVQRIRILVLDILNMRNEELCIIREWFTLLSMLTTLATKVISDNDIRAVQRLVTANASTLSKLRISVVGEANEAFDSLDGVLYDIVKAKEYKTAVNISLPLKFHWGHDSRHKNEKDYVEWINIFDVTDKTRVSYTIEFVQITDEYIKDAWVDDYDHLYTCLESDTLPPVPTAVHVFQNPEAVWPEEPSSFICHAWASNAMPYQGFLPANVVDFFQGNLLKVLAYGTYDIPLFCASPGQWRLEEQTIEAWATLEELLSCFRDILANQIFVASPTRLRLLDSKGVRFTEAQASSSIHENADFAYFLKAYHAFGVPVWIDWGPMTDPFSACDPQLQIAYKFLLPPKHIRSLNEGTITDDEEEKRFAYEYASSDSASSVSTRQRLGETWEEFFCCLEKETKLMMVHESARDARKRETRDLIAKRQCYPTKTSNVFVWNSVDSKDYLKRRQEEGNQDSSTSGPSVGPELIRPGMNSHATWEAVYTEMFKPKLQGTVPTRRECMTLEEVIWYQCGIITTTDGIIKGYSDRFPEIHGTSVPHVLVICDTGHQRFTVMIVESWDKSITGYEIQITDEKDAQFNLILYHATDVLHVFRLPYLSFPNRLYTDHVDSHQTSKTSEQYLWKRGALFGNPATVRAALMHGGIIWCTSLWTTVDDPSFILSGFERLGPCTENTIQWKPNVSHKDSWETWRETLSESQIDVICGVYKVHSASVTGFPTQDVSWFPKPKAFKKSGLDLGFWSADA
ncbi:uncharacterized protein EV420DRAFT_1477562 [Desarmillaria tabescens]|uniref:Uncharacterized protein n=1 Tax=Armillaria tabescens TaxID=1929756 RepID=A0AA39NA41_ARMTA|nr:uncharacterized protein EV420DRAFT_1477562 [Desarmillaria tabescens]KAK0461842.1 hypothetical protein EV420DRAFT_1477562 [Desarmillaria tabescens]